MNMKKLHRICEILTLCLTCLLLGSTLKVEATDYQTKLTAEELATISDDITSCDCSILFWISSSHRSSYGFSAAKLWQRYI